MLKEFGYLPDALDLSVGDLSIKTLPDLAKKNAAIDSRPDRRNGWIGAPAGHRIFGLSKTHQIAHAASDDQPVEFLVWVLGFLVGMRLTTAQAGFLDATPCKTGKLVDFLCSGKNLVRALGQADGFFAANHAGPAPGLAVSAIHALFVAQGPHLLCYERFLYLYTALDACWALTQSQKQLSAKSHADRIPQMCGAWGPELPDWAKLIPGKNASRLSQVRNEMIHEGLVDGEPLGFRIIESFDGSPNPGGNPLLEVENFLNRLLIAILGIDAPAYIRSPVGTRMRFPLEVGP